MLESFRREGGTSEETLSSSSFARKAYGFNGRFTEGGGKKEAPRASVTFVALPNGRKRRCWDDCCNHCSRGICRRGRWKKKTCHKLLPLSWRRTGRCNLEGGYFLHLGDERLPLSRLKKCGREVEKKTRVQSRKDKTTQQKQTGV